MKYHVLVSICMLSQAKYSVTSFNIPKSRSEWSSQASERISVIDTHSHHSTSANAKSRLKSLENNENQYQHQHQHQHQQFTRNSSRRNYLKSMGSNILLTFGIPGLSFAENTITDTTTTNEAQVVLTGEIKKVRFKLSCNCFTKKM